MQGPNVKKCWNMDWVLKHNVILQDTFHFSTAKRSTWDLFNHYTKKTFNWGCDLVSAVYVDWVSTATY